MRDDHILMSSLLLCDKSSDETQLLLEYENSLYSVPIGVVVIDHIYSFQCPV